MGRQRNIHPTFTHVDRSAATPHHEPRARRMPRPRRTHHGRTNQGHGQLALVISMIQVALDLVVIGALIAVATRTGDK
jgi:hypothetical protein